MLSISSERRKLGQESFPYTTGLCCLESGGRDAAALLPLPRSSSWWSRKGFPLLHVEEALLLKLGEERKGWYAPGTIAPSCSLLALFLWVIRTNDDDSFIKESNFPGRETRTIVVSSWVTELASWNGLKKGHEIALRDRIFSFFKF